MDAKKTHLHCVDGWRLRHNTDVGLGHLLFRFGGVQLDVVEGSQVHIRPCTFFSKRLGYFITAEINIGVDQSIGAHFKWVRLIMAYVCTSGATLEGTAFIIHSVYLCSKNHKEWLAYNHWLKSKPKKRSHACQKLPHARECRTKHHPAVPLVCKPVRVSHVMLAVI